MANLTKYIEKATKIQFEILDDFYDKFSIRHPNFILPSIIFQEEKEEMKHENY